MALSGRLSTQAVWVVAAPDPVLPVVVFSNAYPGAGWLLQNDETPAVRAFRIPETPQNARGRSGAEQVLIS
jgi:hypothetical protein